MSVTVRTPGIQGPPGPPGPPGDGLAGGLVELAKITTPANPSAGAARLFVQDDGSGNLQLAVLFPSGEVATLATASTPTDPVTPPPTGFPGVDNTGWQNSPSATGTLATYSGPDTLRAVDSGQTFTNVAFEGLTVGVVGDEISDVHFVGCRFRSSWSDGWNVAVAGTNVTFDHCTFEPLNSQSLPVAYGDSYQYGLNLRGESSVTLTACDIYGFGNALQIEQSTQANPVIVRDCWIHDAADQANDVYHHDGFLSNNGGPAYIVLDHNTIHSGGNTNAVALQSTGTPYDHIEVTNNLLGGFGYTVNIGDGYAPSNTNITFTGNTLWLKAPLPRWGPYKNTWADGNGNTWSGNKFLYEDAADPTLDGKYWLPGSAAIGSGTAGTGDWSLAHLESLGIAGTADYTPPVPAQAYRIWPATNGPDTDAADTAAYSMGMAFSVSAAAQVTEIHYYRGTTAVTPVVTGGIFETVGGTQVGASVTFPDPGTATGWITATLATPIPVSPGTVYKVVVQYPNNYTSTSHYWDTGAGVGGLTNGILTAPDATTAPGGQGTFSVGSTLAYPTETFQGGNYWVDVTVEG